MFEPVPSHVSFPKLEEDVLRFWDTNHIFEKSLTQRQGSEPYVFYDGPPFATGLPHYGHLLAGTIKDVVPRYQTMRGKYVERTFGWDCHGLPIEALAQEALGLAGAPAIKEAGIDVFNETCRSMVLTYVDEWRKTVTRMGRWVDFDHGYKTMDTSFMETIWWVFKRLWDQGRVYKAHRIMPYSWKLNTPLSNFEANRNYQDTQDPAVTVRMRVTRAPFDLDCEGHVYVIVWTTTPWTLPSNLAACVGPDIDYVALKDTETGDAYLMAEERVDAYYKSAEQYDILTRLKGTELAGLKYEPLFPYFSGHPGAFHVLVDEFVTTSDGTGIVHMAPAYGEDDYRICREAGIDLIDPLDDDACFTDEVPPFAGMNCKEADKHIIRHLKDAGKLVHQSTIVHSYPFCERTDTPLIYRAIDAWYVKVEDLHDRLKASNERISWMPEYVGEKRFGNWLAEAKDWNISRNRFWGSCIPVWVNVDDPDDVICVGSAAELEELSGQNVDDLHKHIIDKIAIVRDGKTYRRTPEVLDCWFESGSMPYAQHHYPFENKDKVESHFPADFIAEGLDQTRGWFYTLVVLSTALFDKPAFKNVVVNGLILAEDGRKMSKRLKNYPDPATVMDASGADALRLCMLSSPVVRAEDLRFSESAVRESLRTVIIPLWNAYSFLVTYARVDGWEPENNTDLNPANVLDQWILSRLQQAVGDITTSMDRYDLQRSALRFTGLIDELTNWYIRRSRRRFWKSQNDTDKDEAYATLRHVLITFCQLAAPFIPFVTETIYRNLRSEDMPESVHLCDFPRVNDSLLDEALCDRMAHTMTAVSLGRYLRTQTKLRIRQPLAEAVLVSANAAVRRDLEAMSDVIGEELNVKRVDVRADEEALVDLSAKANFRALGPRFSQHMKAAAAAVAGMTPEQIADLRRTGRVILDVNGQPEPFTTDDVLVQRNEKDGITVANEGHVTVALDTRLTDALRTEGWARELVSRIQNMRKDMGLDVADRIHVVFDVSAEAGKAVEIFGDYIAAEVLADSLDVARMDDGETVDINGQAAKIKVTKA
ncbi:MAG: isoleucine--tRNA ligase [Lentisphaeria bacterium]|nr:isoleucine--tRNA ligase [Lentisphaeria bacterium]